jgi:Fic family protein
MDYKKLWKSVKELLQEANDISIDPVERALKLYLDILFFHPFRDGNSRVARIAMEYVLRRNELALTDVEPILVDLRAKDPHSISMTS